VPGAGQSRVSNQCVKILHLSNRSWLAHLMIVEKCLDLAAKWAHFVLVQDNFLGEALEPHRGCILILGAHTFRGDLQAALFMAAGGHLMQDQEQY
jgi:hypothetical protein